MPEEKKGSRLQRSRRYIAAGLISGGVGCGCGLIVLVLVLAGSISTAAALDPVIMSIQPLLILVSGMILAATIVFNLKLQKCCNLRGAMAQKKLILITVAIYGFFLILLFLIQPYLMATIDRIMPT